MLAQRRACSVRAGQAEPTAATRKREVRGKVAKFLLCFTHNTDYLFLKVFIVEEVAVKGQVAENGTRDGWSCYYSQYSLSPERKGQALFAPLSCRFPNLLSA